MGLTVAVTGPTGEIGTSVLRALEQERRVDRVLGMARRPFDPASRGWRTTEYRQGDGLDRAAVAGLVARPTWSCISRTSSWARVRRASGSISPASATCSRLPFRLIDRAGWCTPRPWRPTATTSTTQCRSPRTSPPAARPSTTTPRRRPPARHCWPRSLPAPTWRCTSCGRASWPGQRQRCWSGACRGAGPPSAYNLAGDGEITMGEFARALGGYAIPVPGALVGLTSTLVERLPFLPPEMEWVHTARHPMLMDTTKARRELGWAPAHTAHETLTAMVDAERDRAAW